jgi:hypothetical protein
MQYCIDLVKLLLSLIDQTLYSLTSSEEFLQYIHDENIKISKE